MVLDPCAGSGCLLRAAQDAGARHTIGSDLSADFFPGGHGVANDDGLKTLPDWYGKFLPGGPELATDDALEASPDWHGFQLPNVLLGHGILTF